MSDHDTSYAAKLTDLLGRSDAAHRVFVDVGAHKGDFSAMLNGAFPDSKIYAIEADADLCAGLDERLGRNLGAEVTNCILHEKNATLDFLVHADRGTSSILPRSGGTRRYFHSSDRVVQTRRVPSISFDEFVVAKGISAVHLLKLDTQGAEAAILRGAHDSLARGLVDVIYTEFFVVPHYDGAALFPELCQQLADHHYFLYDLFKGPCGSNGQLRFGDAIFVSPEFRQRCVDRFGSEP